MGAVLIDGPKAVDKTRTAVEVAASLLRMAGKIDHGRHG